MAVRIKREAAMDYADLSEIRVERMKEVDVDVVGRMWKRKNE